MKKIVCKVGVLTKTIRLLPFITIYANPIKAGWKDFAIDIGWLCFAIGMRFNKPSKLINMKHYHEEEIPIEEDFNPWDEKERAV